MIKAAEAKLPTMAKEIEDTEFVKSQCKWFASSAIKAQLLLFHALYFVVFEATHPCFMPVCKCQWSQNELIVIADVLGIRVNSNDVRAFVTRLRTNFGREAEKNSEIKTAWTVKFAAILNSLISEISLKEDAVFFSDSHLLFAET